MVYHNLSWHNYGAEIETFFYITSQNRSFYIYIKTVCIVILPFNYSLRTLSINSDILSHDAITNYINVDIFCLDSVLQMAGVGVCA